MNLRIFNGYLKYILKIFVRCLKDIYGGYLKNILDIFEGYKWVTIEGFIWIFAADI